MEPNPQFSVDLITWTEETLNGKLHFLCSVITRIPKSLKNFPLQAIDKFLTT